MQLNGKRIVVVGGGGGFGAAVVARLVAAGARLAVADIDLAAAEAVAAGIPKAAPFHVDVTSRESVETAFGAAEAWLDGFDGLVYSAGIARHRHIVDVSSQDWDRVMDVNLTGAFHCCQYAARAMVRRAVGGSIIAVASVAATRHGSGTSVYSATKAGLSAFVHAIAVDLAPDGIRANVIDPGPANTALVATAHSAAFRAAYERAIPMKRYGEPHEIAGAVAFLASDEASYVTARPSPSMEGSAMPAPSGDVVAVKSIDVLWIGYGKMGQPMCDRVAAAGHRVTVAEIGTTRRDAAAANGLDVTDDPAAAAFVADVVVSSLPSDDAFRTVLAGDGGVLAQCRPGTLLIDTSTISVDASCAVAAGASVSRVGYVRAPVSGTVAAAAKGLLSCFVSGPDDALARAAPIIGCYAGKIVPVGGDEQARVMKLAVNLMVHTLMVSLSEAYAFCRKGGVAPKVAIDAICASAIASPHLTLKADCLLRGDFTPTFTVTQTRRDMKLVTEGARELGVPVLLGAVVEQIVAAAESTGLGELDYIAHGKLISHLAGL